MYKKLRSHVNESGGICSHGPSTKRNTNIRCLRTRNVKENVRIIKNSFAINFDVRQVRNILKNRRADASIKS